MTFSVPALGTKAVTQVKKGTRNKPAMKLLCYLCICDSIFLTGCPSSNCAMTDHTENVICDHTQFEYQGICRKLSGWKLFQIHVCFYLAVKLLTFSMGMKQTDDFLTRVTKVCPPDFNFNSGNKIEPIIFINGSFRNLVADTECKLFIELLTGNGFPVTAYINSFRYLPEQDHLQEQSVVFYL